MTSQFYSQPLFRLLWPPVYGGMVYLLILLLNNNLDQLQESFFGQELYFFIALSFIVFETNRVAFVLWSKQKSFTEMGIGPMISLGVIMLPLTALVVIVSTALYFIYVLGFSSIEPFQSELLNFSIIFSVSAIFYLAICVSNIFLYQENEKLIEEEMQLRDNLEEELLRFKGDLNTTFLYDCLEALIPLFYQNSEMAEEFIDRMAMVYRYVLTNRNADLVELNEELKASKNVISLLNNKYQGNIDMQNGLAKTDLEQLVIPGSVISIIEEIINNSLISPSQPLKIELSTEDKYLTINHRLNETLRPQNTGKVDQLQNAYSIFTEHPVVVVKAFGENFIKLPLLKLQSNNDEGINN